MSLPRFWFWHRIAEQVTTVTQKHHRVFCQHQKTRIVRVLARYVEQSVCVLSSQNVCLFWAFCILSDSAGAEEPECLLLSKCWRADLLWGNCVLFYSLRSLNEQNEISLMSLGILQETVNFQKVYAEYYSK